MEPCPQPLLSFYIVLQAEVLGRALHGIRLQCCHCSPENTINQLKYTVEKKIRLQLLIVLTNGHLNCTSKLL